MLAYLARASSPANRGIPNLRRGRRRGSSGSRGARSPRRAARHDDGSPRPPHGACRAGVDTEDPRTRPAGESHAGTEADHRLRLRRSRRAVATARRSARRRSRVRPRAGRGRPPRRAPTPLATAGDRAPTRCRSSMSRGSRPSLPTRRPSSSSLPLARARSRRADSRSRVPRAWSSRPVTSQRRRPRPLGRDRARRCCRAARDALWPPIDRARTVAGRGDASGR